MEETLTTTIPDPELAKLEQMAVEHDTQAQEELSANEPEPAQPAAEEKKPEGEINPDNSETDPEPKKAERPRDELGRFTKTEEGTDIPEAERKPAEKEPEKAETPYSKAKKEEERRDRSWKALEEEKKQTRAEVERWRVQLQREADELQRAREQRATPEPSQSQQSRYSSTELWNAANDFDARAEKAFEAGDGETFKESLKLAREARQQAGQVQQLEQQAQQQAQEQRRIALYHQNMEAVIKDDPELSKPDSEISKEVVELIKQAPVLDVIPDGFPIAVQVAKWKRDAGLVSELRDKLTKAEAEVQRLTKERTPLGAGPTTPIQAKNFDSLSTDDQMKQLERMAEQHDLAAA